MQIGTGRAVITPALGTWLSGYENGRRTESVLDDLQLRTFWFQQGDKDEAAACIVTADLLGFHGEIIDQIQQDLCDKFDLLPQSIMLAASHTHCGPQTCENMPANGGLPVPEYVAKLRRQIVEAVGEARTNRRPATLRIGRGHLNGYAINRRLMVDGESVMAPNAQGSRDDEVTAIIGSDAETNEVRLVLFHFTCHPTLLGGPYASGDYVGGARRRLETTLEGVTAGFLPGCFGDVRPNAVYIGGRKFRAATPADAEAFGNALGDEVVRVVQATANSQPLQTQVASHASLVDLPLQQEAGTVPLSLQRIDLAEELSLIAMGGEMGVDYGHFVKSLEPNRRYLPVGYANGLLAYICPAYQYGEGGFEPILSCEGYGLPGPLKPETEQIIHSAIRKIVR